MKTEGLAAFHSSFAFFHSAITPARLPPVKPLHAMLQK
jgi:hypothetical protein